MFVPILSFYRQRMKYVWNSCICDDIVWKGGNRSYQHLAYFPIFFPNYSSSAKLKHESYWYMANRETDG